MQDPSLIDAQVEIAAGSDIPPGHEVSAQNSLPQAVPDIGDIHADDLGATPEVPLKPPQAQQNTWAGVPDENAQPGREVRGKTQKTEGHWEKTPSGYQFIQDHVWYE